jgi:cell division protein FtsB
MLPDEGPVRRIGQGSWSRYNPDMFKLAVIALLVVFAGLQYRLWVGDGSLAQVHRIAQLRDTLHLQNAKDRTRNAAMQVQIDDLKSGALATEGRARSEMGMVKPDETFFLTLDGKSRPAAQASAN